MTADALTEAIRAKFALKIEIFEKMAKMDQHTVKMIIRGMKYLSQVKGSNYLLLEETTYKWIYIISMSWRKLSRQLFNKLFIAVLPYLLRISKQILQSSHQLILLFRQYFLEILKQASNYVKLKAFNANITYFKSLLNGVQNISNYFTQKFCLEIIVKFFLLTKMKDVDGVVNNLFADFAGDSKLPNIFLQFLTIEFEMNCRNFLNCLNKTKPAPRTIVSIAAKTVFLAERQLLTHKDMPFWIDFALTSHEISFFVAYNIIKKNQNGYILFKISRDQIKRISTQMYEDYYELMIELIADVSVSDKAAVYFVKSKRFIKMAFAKNKAQEHLENTVLPEYIKMIDRSVSSGHMDGVSEVSDINQQNHSESNVESPSKTPRKSKWTIYEDSLKVDENSNKENNLGPGIETIKSIKRYPLKQIDSCYGNVNEPERLDYNISDTSIKTPPTLDAISTETMRIIHPMNANPVLNDDPTDVYNFLNYVPNPTDFLKPQSSGHKRNSKSVRFDCSQSTPKRKPLSFITTPKSILRRNRSKTFKPLNIKIQSPVTNVDISSRSNEAIKGGPVRSPVLVKPFQAPKSVSKIPQRATLAIKYRRKSLPISFKVFDNTPKRQLDSVKTPCVENTPVMEVNVTNKETIIIDEPMDVSLDNLQSDQQAGASLYNASIKKQHINEILRSEAENKVIDGDAHTSVAVSNAADFSCVVSEFETVTNIEVPGHDDYEMSGFNKLTYTISPQIQIVQDEVVLNDDITVQDLAEIEVHKPSTLAIVRDHYQTSASICTQNLTPTIVVQSNGIWPELTGKDSRVNESSLIDLAPDDTEAVADARVKGATLKLTYTKRDNSQDELNNNETSLQIDEIQEGVSNISIINRKRKAVDCPNPTKDQDIASTSLLINSKIFKMNVKRHGVCSTPKRNIHDSSAMQMSNTNANGSTSEAGTTSKLLILKNECFNEHQKIIDHLLQPFYDRVEKRQQELSNKKKQIIKNRISALEKLKCTERSANLKTQKSNLKRLRSMKNEQDDTKTCISTFIANVNAINSKFESAQTAELERMEMGFQELINGVKGARGAMWNRYINNVTANLESSLTNFRLNGSNLLN